MSKIILPLKFKQLLETDKHYAWIDGGRLGGKTNNTALIGVLGLLEYPYTDIIVARVSYGAMADSSYAEFENAINMFPEYSDQFKLKRSPLRVIRKGDSGTIYFIGYGGSNTSRTKSIRTKHKIKMVIMEETQELKSRENLDQALASFRRHFGDDVLVCILGNPPAQEAHWFNVMRNEKIADPDWLVLRVTYLDILPFINDFDLKEILKQKILNREYYEWFYMGETTNGFGSVYPMFRKDKHIISYGEWSIIREKGLLRCVGCVIGGDGAVNNDSTAFVPLLLLNNGQAVIGKIFVHDPKVDGVIGYHTLVQDHLTRWFDELCREWNLGSRQELRLHPNARQLPIFMRIDSAAPDLIQECRFFLGDRASIGPIKKLHVPQMVASVQSAICNNNIMIIDYGFHYDYYMNKQVKDDMNLLAKQISMLIWNEKQDNYDPIVPNDICDAFTYGTLFWYGNQENIQYFNILKANNISNKLISDLIKDMKQKE